MPARRSAVLVAAALITASACSSGGGKKAAPPRPPTTTTTAAAPLKVTASAATVDSMRDPAPPFPDDLRDQVLATLTSYLSAGIAAPLRTAQPSAGLDGVFTADALARLAPGGPDRAALIEEPAPVAGTVHPDTATATLVALAGQNGEIGMVNANVTLTVTATNGGSRVQIARTGDLVLVPAAGGWRIDSYDMSTKRDTAPAPVPSTTTTTAKAKKK
ncbi:MAG TPA: hypothetical protein VFA94_03430 [Acidimicrobiales bacterium]|nr:hypothetical protein [Acidimicrobiales bacterium]